jgi:hypothetical protein
LYCGDPLHLGVINRYEEQTFYNGKD